MSWKHSLDRLSSTRLAAFAWQTGQEGYSPYSPCMHLLLQVKKDVAELYNEFAPQWEREENERVKRWEQFLDASFCGHLAGRSRDDPKTTQRMRRESHLQGLGVWLSEYHASSRLLSEERCTQVRSSRSCFAIAACWQLDRLSPMLSPRCPCWSALIQAPGRP